MMATPSPVLDLCELKADIPSQLEDYVERDADPAEAATPLGLAKKIISVECLASKALLKDLDGNLVTFEAWEDFDEGDVDTVVQP